jgi:hypothetical protein
MKNMKKLIVLALAVMAFRQVSAQTFAEWFEQRKTRIQYMLKQIAALQVYIGDAEKGYKIVEQGVHTIGDIKNGEFNLHDVFFNSLKTVSPTVKNMAEIGEIIALQASIVEQFRRSLKTYGGSGVITDDELGYCGKVYSTLVSAGLKDTDALLALLTDDALGMDDGHRMVRVKEIDQDMRDQYGFMRDFTGGTDLLVQQRLREQGDDATLMQLYGIK